MQSQSIFVFTKYPGIIIINYIKTPVKRKHFKDLYSQYIGHIHINIPGILHNKIFEERGQKVMLDFDLAELYEVATKRLNEQGKRNSDKFPEDFMFRLTENEWEFIQLKSSSAPENGNWSQIATGSENGNSSQIVMSSEINSSSQFVMMGLFF